MDEFVTGNIALYTLDCPLCTDGTIKIINHLQQQSIENFSEKVLFMVNHPTKKTVFFLTLHAIKEYNLPN